MQEMWVRFLGQEDPLEEEMATHQYPCLKSHEQGSLSGYSPWGCKRVGHDLTTKQQHNTPIEYKYYSMKES
jgi:hypothetical protein